MVPVHCVVVGAQDRAENPAGVVADATQEARLGFVPAPVIGHGDAAPVAQPECWGDDVPDGKLTDFKRSVALQDGETVAVGWITWPDKAVRDAGWEALMQDERMMGGAPPPFDGKRMIFAGFEVIAEG
jgi:uncharacterized protein YbaA (DUF1428 family)